MPIKRNEHIVKLSQDHHASLLFCWKIRQGIKHHVDAERIIKYVRYFWKTHFSIHFKEEEEILFAPISDPMIDKAIQDHKAVRQMIIDLDAGDSMQSAEKLSKLADAVDNHVRYEERILFPHIETVLSPEQLESIGKLIAGPPFIEDYEDTFWIKSESL